MEQELVQTIKILPVGCEVAGLDVYWIPSYARASHFHKI